MGIFDFFKKKEKEVVKEERKPKIQAPSVNSPSDEEFKMFAFIEIEGCIPYNSENNYWDEFMMEIIQEFLNYINTLDDYYLENFQELSRKANKINQDVMAEQKDYGRILLDFYRDFYNIE